jgi:hypothetical protein
MIRVCGVGIFLHSHDVSIQGPAEDEDSV